MSVETGTSFKDQSPHEDIAVEQLPPVSDEILILSIDAAEFVMSKAQQALNDTEGRNFPDEEIAELNKERGQASKKYQDCVQEAIRRGLLTDPQEGTTEEQEPTTLLFGEES